MGDGTERGVAAPCYRAAFADAHFGIAAVQGVLAEVEKQAGYAGKDFCGAAGLRTGDEGSVFGPGNYFDGGDHRATDRTNAGRFSEGLHFFAAGNAGHDVPSAENIVAADCADGD